MTARCKSNNFRRRTLCALALLATLTLASWSTPAAAAGSAATPLPGGLLQASRAWFSRFPFMKAEDVNAKIVQGGDNGWFLASVQAPDEYARGHVPGAVNIPFRELAEEKSLALFPRGKKIVFTCEDGHRSMAAALFLGQLGYETYAMSMGLGHWNGPGAGVASPYQGSAGYPVSTDSVPPPSPVVLPVVEGSDKDTQKEIVARTRALLSGDRKLFIDRGEVYDKAVKRGDPGYFLVSLQRPEDYADGHVPGAINIPPGDLAKPESLGRLPRDRKIVLVCYIGHWAGSAAMFLNQLGYEAYDMRFGTLGWNDGTEGLGGAKEYLQSLGKSLDLPVEKGMRK
jgi:rhodanese-related sulfurtransferase